jgi:peptidyl-prolyl cis-trans isomerase C
MKGEQRPPEKTSMQQDASRLWWRFLISEPYGGIGAMRSFVFTIFLALMFVVSTTGCSKKGEGSGKSDSTGAALADGTVLVKVEGKAITAKDFAWQQDMMMQQLHEYADSAQIATMMPNIKKQAMDNAINRILLEETIKKLGITVSKEQVDSRVDYYRKNFVSEEAYQADLKKKNLTPEKLRHEVEVGLQAEELFNKRTALIKQLGDAEIRSFYNSNPERFQQGERVKASHILLTVNKDDTDAVRAQKKQEAERILGELKKGADFAEAARKYSNCPSKDQGGDLGYFERGRMVPEFEQVAFALKTGQLSDVVQTQFGYHIIKVTDHAKATKVPFDQAKENISRYLMDQRKQEAITSYFDSLRAASNVQYLDSSFAR